MSTHPTRPNLTDRLGFPLHRVLAPLPSGALLAAFALDIGSHLAAEISFARAAFWVQLLGVVLLLPAGAFGFVDLLRSERGTAPHTTGVLHVVLCDLALVCAGASLLWRRGGDYSLAVPWPAVVLSGAGVAAVILGAVPGAILTYRYGVGRPRTSHPTPEAGAGAAGDQKSG